MGKIMTAAELVSKAKDIAENYATSYIWGGIGTPITEAYIKQAEAHYSKNTTNGYAAKARKLIGNPKAFQFDCVGLIKALLWGWCGDNTKYLGGAAYQSGGVPDTTADGMISRCENVSTDFSGILPGEAVWMSGHIGIYGGAGVVYEATPKWNSGVQKSTITNVAPAQIGGTAGVRKWTKHGKLPWVDYGAAKDTMPARAAAPAASAKTINATEAAHYFDKTLAGTYIVTASSLNVRNGAGTTKKVLTTIPKGTAVKNYGYFSTDSRGVKWLYIQFKQNGTVYTAFASGAYLSKK